MLAQTAHPAASATALVVYLIGLAAAFGWRTVAHWRATANTGYRGANGRPGTLTWWGSILFGVALALGTAAPILVLTGVTTPSWWHPGLPPTGLATILAGIAITLTAQRQLGASWRIGVDPGEYTTLVVAGLFAHIRNPFFTGILTVMAGLTIMVPTAISALGCGCLVTAVQIQVRRVEEPYLIATHGAAYRHYAARAGRFLPGIGRLNSWAGGA